MSIPESTLAKWSHHEAGTEFKQAHVPIREALEAHRGLSQFKYEVFLQGSYKNDTNLGGDSDVDVVVQLSSKLKPAVAALTGETAARGWFPQVRIPTMEVVPGRGAEGPTVQIREGRKERPQDPEGAEGQDPGRRRPCGHGESQRGHRVLSLRRAALGRQLSAAAPCQRVEKGKGGQRSVQEDDPHVQGGPEPDGRKEGVHQS